MICWRIRERGESFVDQKMKMSLFVEAVPNGQNPKTAKTSRYFGQETPQTSQLAFDGRAIVNLVGRPSPCSSFPDFWKIRAVCGGVAKV